MGASSLSLGRRVNAFTFLFPHVIPLSCNVLGFFNWKRLEEFVLGFSKPAASDEEHSQ